MARIMDMFERQEGRGSLYLVLLDPDHSAPAENARLAGLAEGAGADMILVGGSFTMSGRAGETVSAVRSAVSLPVVIFPGNAGFLAEGADAVLFLSLVSGRNPQFLIGEQVLAAPTVRRMGLEVIPTAYMIVESGSTTSVEFMSGTKPLPRDKPDIAMAHALASQYLGMRLVFLDAGSGAADHVPEDMVRAVSGYVDVPVMVGGGIRTPESARRLAESGARLLVTGDIVERTGDAGLMREIASAVHGG